MLNPVAIILSGVGLVLVLGLLLRVWNHFTGKYNDNILAMALCKHCTRVLGKACIEPARRKWRQEMLANRQAGRSGVWRSNLELICPHCGSVNQEQEVYLAHKGSSR